MNHRLNCRLLMVSGAAIVLISMTTARAEDGYRLWLRYDSLPTKTIESYRPRIRSIIAPGKSLTMDAIRSELINGCTGLLGYSVLLTNHVEGDGVVIAGTPQTSADIAALRWHRQLAALGPEGFMIRSARLKGHAVTVIAASHDIGALYGAFYFLRLIQTLQPIASLNVSERPHLQLRMLDHWDNLDGSIERGYAGKSLWNWSELPGKIDPRLRDYARANASIGINGSALNNVNANAQILTADYLRKVAAIADVFRPYGIHVYLSARFSAPIELGGSKTADPLDPEVAAWWKTKADEIYQAIPDFGGFLVKANSEGQPGPRTYGRTQADGANVIADALAPHGGTVLWRAFVYGGSKEDRAKQAYDEFRPLDGKFRANVIVQVKNGPIDFQPREPFHPLFGQMPHTRIALEVQLTREYLGQSDGVVFLAPMWTE